MPRQNRGSQGAPVTQLTGMAPVMPATVDGATIQDYAKCSTKCLYLDALADPAPNVTTIKDPANLIESGEFESSDNDWRELAWDNSVQLIVLKPRNNGLRYLTTINRSAPPDITSVENGDRVDPGDVAIINTENCPNGSIFINNADAGDFFVLGYTAYGENGLENAPQQLPLA